MGLGNISVLLLMDGIKPRLIILMLSIWLFVFSACFNSYVFFFFAEELIFFA